MNLTYILPICVVIFFIVGSWADLKRRRHRFEDRQRLREANWRAGDRRR